jgi:hypothetical protein
MKFVVVVVCNREFRFANPRDNYMIVSMKVQKTFSASLFQSLSGSTSGTVATLRHDLLKARGLLLEGSVVHHWD